MLGFQDKWILTLSIISWQNDPREDNFFLTKFNKWVQEWECVLQVQACVLVCVCVCVSVC